MKVQKLTHYFISISILLCLLFLPAVGQNLIKNGGFDDDSVWEVYNYTGNDQPEYEFNNMNDSLRFGKDGYLYVWTEDTDNAQTMFWQRITAIAGETYRLSAALKVFDFDYPMETGNIGPWMQIYISPDVPGDPVDGDWDPPHKAFDVTGWSADCITFDIDGLWEEASCQSDLDFAPSYYIPEGTPGEEVELTIAINFGHYWGEGNLASFWVACDEVSFVPVSSNIVKNGGFDDDSVWDEHPIEENDQPEYEFNYTEATPRFGIDGCLRASTIDWQTADKIVWQEVTAIAGETYRVTGAVRVVETDYPTYDSPPVWLQMYVSPELEIVGNWNPDKIYNSSSSVEGCELVDVDGLFDGGACEYQLPGKPVNYFTPEGAQGEEVPLIFAINIGMWWGAGDLGSFDIVCDEFAMYKVSGEVESKVESNPKSSAPKKFALQQCYPNPFNPATTIEYSLAKAGHVQLIVYDLLGNQVAMPVNALAASGRHIVSFDGSDLSSGIYVYSLQHNGQTINRKMMLMK